MRLTFPSPHDNTISDRGRVSRVRVSRYNATFPATDLLSIMSDSERTIVGVCMFWQNIVVW